MTMLISTHILGEIEQIADTIGVINKGRLLEEVSMNAIREKTTDYIEIVTKDCKKTAYVLENNLNISNFRVIDNDIIRIYEDKVSQTDISKTLILNDVAIESINRKNSSLEDYFMNLLNGEVMNA